MSEVRLVVGDLVYDSDEVVGVDVPGSGYVYARKSTVNQVVVLIVDGTAVAFGPMPLLP